MYQPPHNNKLTIVRFNRTIQAAAAACIPRSSRGMAWWVLSSKKVASPAPYVFEGKGSRPYSNASHGGIGLKRSARKSISRRTFADSALPGG